MKNLSIISVNYNGFDVTCEMIDSLYRVGFEGEIVIVDNASRVDETVSLLQKYPLITAIRSEKNLGFAGGNNLGIAQAKGDYLMFLNNDTTVDDKFWIPLVERFDKDPSVGMVCPKILFEYAPDTIQFAGYTLLHPITFRNRMIGFNEKDEGQHEQPLSIPYAMGAAMLTNKAVVAKAGVMPEPYFLYYEELDWSERIREQGYSIWYEPKSHIYHKESAATGRMSPLKQYYLTRNRLFYLRRNSKGFYLFVGIIYQILISLAKNCLTSLLQRRFDLFFATLKGVTHGMKMVVTYDGKCC